MAFLVWWVALLVGVTALFGCGASPSTVLPQFEFDATPAPESVPDLPRRPATYDPFESPAPPPPLFPEAPSLDRPLDLEACLILAEHRNKQLIAARQRLSEADAGIGVAAAIERPTASVAGSFTAYNRTPRARLPAIGLEFPIRDRDAIASRLDVRLPLFAVTRDGALAQLARSQVIAGVDQTRQAVRRAVVEAFFKARAAGARLSVLRAARDVRRRYAADARARFQAEALARHEWRLAEAEARIAAQRVTAAQAAWESARLALGQLLGIPASAPLLELTATPVAPLAINAEALPEAVAYALAHRPELPAQAVTTQTLAVRREALEARRKPRVDLAYRLTYTDDELQVPDTLHTGTFALSWNPFSGGTIAARLDANDARRARLATRAEQTARAIAQEVRQAHLAYQAASQAIEPLTAAVAAARDNAEAVRDLFAAGSATVAEVLQAEYLLTDAEQQLAVADVTRARAVCRFRLALGAGADRSVTGVLAETVLTPPKTPEAGAATAEAPPP